MLIDQVIQKLNGLLQGFSLHQTTNHHFIVKTPIFTNNEATVYMYIPCHNDKKHVLTDSEGNFIISDNHQVLGKDYYLLKENNAEDIQDYLKNKYQDIYFRDGEFLLVTNFADLNKKMLDFSNTLLKFDNYI